MCLVHDLGLTELGSNVGGWEAAFMGHAEVPDVWLYRAPPRPGANAALRPSPDAGAAAGGRTDVSFLGAFAAIAGGALSYVRAIRIFISWMGCQSTYENPYASPDRRYYPHVSGCSRLCNTLAGFCAVPLAASSGAGAGGGAPGVPQSPLTLECAVLVLKTLCHNVGQRLRRGAIERIIERRRARGRGVAGLIRGAELLQVRPTR